MWWKPEKGYGRIAEDESNQVYFAHFTGLEGGVHHLERGQRVTFAFRGGRQDHGMPRAEAVRPREEDQRAAAREE